MPFKSPSSALPLTPVAFEILLALSASDLHGYAILQEVERRAGSSVPLRTGTLYRALARLLEDGLIEERPSPAGETDERRRYYRLTDHGRATLSAEARRLADQVAAARAHRLLPKEHK